MEAISLSLLRGRFSSRVALLGLAVATAALTGCYVVPVNPQTGQASQVHSTPPSMPVPVPSSVVFAARLYPANDAAARYGMVGAVVTNDLNGHGTLATINGGKLYW